MGRLFWKVFFGFWLVMLAAIGIAVAVVFIVQDNTNDERLGRTTIDGELLKGRRVNEVVAQHAQVMRHGGVRALRAYMRESHRRRAQSNRKRSRVLVVNRAGIDIMGREVPAAALSQARSQAVMLPTATDTSQPVSAQDQETLGLALNANAITVSDPRGREFLFFMARPQMGTLARRSMPIWARLPTWTLIAIGLAFSLIFSGALAWYMARPIRALKAGLRRVADGDLEARVAPEIGARRDELADLGRDVDRTTERLAKLIQSQRRLLHDVSHELRSPLARLQAAVGIIRQTPDRLPSLLDRLEDECHRLDRLVAEILTLARLDEDLGHENIVQIDLRELLADIVSDAAFEGHETRVGVTLADGESGTYSGHPTLLARAIENLVRNAIKFSPPDTCVEVSMERLDGGWRINICDSGPGIDPDKMELMQQPFSRGTGDQAGFGLGLAIARRAVEIHSGRLTLVNREQGGLCASIWLAPRLA